jgi:hypothetical protein
MAKTQEQIAQEIKARRRQPTFVGPVGMVPGGEITPESVAQAVLDRRLAQAPQELPQTSFRQRLAEMNALESQAGQALGETVATVASGAVAEPVSGLVGLVTTPFQGLRQGVRNIAATQQAMTYQPRSQLGQQMVRRIGEALQPVAQPLQKASQYLGEKGFQAGGPLLGAAGETIIPATMELAGLGSVRTARRVAGAPIAPEAEQVIRAGEMRHVPVTTSDVLPPQNFASRWMQSMYEKIPFIGGANQRQAQQALRQEAVQGLADEFGLQLDSIGDLSVDLVNSIQTENAARLKRAAQQRKAAIDVLDPAGVVPLNTTMTTIDRLIAEQNALGARADQSLVRSLSDIKDSLQNFDPAQQRQTGRNFSGVKDIRSTVIDDLKAINRSDDPRRFGPLQQVKSAIDKDMVAFARNTDQQAAADWLKSNRVFATELENARRTELRKAFNSANTTPEKILPLLRGGVRSDLERLNRSLTPQGQRAARSAILYDALAESGYFADPLNANPDRLANALKRQNRLQAVDVFFSGSDKDALQGFSRLLDATRRAQQAGVVTPTGQQLVPFALGGAALTEPVMTAISTATLAGIGRFYESAGMRNFLLKLNNTKAGSPQEMSVLEAAVPALTAAVKSLAAQQSNEE